MEETMDMSVRNHVAEDFASRDEVRAIQARKLIRLGERLQHSEVWKKHFRSAGVSALDLTGLDVLSNFPMLEKIDLRAMYPFPMLTVELDKVMRFTATSGTTGLPVLFGFTAKDWRETVVKQLCRIFRTVGIVPGDRVYQGYGYGLWVGGSSMDEAIQTYGAVNFPIGPGRSDLMPTWIRDHAYDATTMSPLWLMTLITHAHKVGVNPRKDWKLRVGLFGGQSVSTAFRDQMEAMMPDGFMAHNIYGSTEAGGPIVGISCEHSHAADEMHLINDDSVLTEIIDPVSFRPVGPGEVGELVLTTLDKEASPVVRWRTRDLVRLSDHPYGCPCGRHGFPLVGRIIGRSDDMMKVRGVMVFPSQIEDVIASQHGTVKEAWQVYIDSQDGSMDQIEVAFERANQASLCATSLEGELKSLLRARLGLTCTVKCYEEGQLPRYEGKATRVVKRQKS
ncbi:Acyl-CoA ligase [Paraburkholderia piptadeniae]|nr:Acyl-CoA ligase [Paraburkholderia piptadeniae]